MIAEIMFSTRKDISWDIKRLLAKYFVTIWWTAQRNIKWSDLHPVISSYLNQLVHAMTSFALLMVSLNNTVEFYICKIQFYWEIWRIKSASFNILYDSSVKLQFSVEFWYDKLEIYLNIFIKSIPKSTSYFSFLNFRYYLSQQMKFVAANFAYSLELCCSKVIITYSRSKIRSIHSFPTLLSFIRVILL